jgi:4-hydroxybenzoate polyprenyltransferase
MSKPFFYALRPTQWVKNIFVFLPAFFSGKLSIFPFVLKIAETFIFFCIASSSVYLINDSFDVEKDKAHHIKSLRSIASGKLGIKQAVVVALIIGSAACILSLSLDARLSVILAVYIIFNFFYSKWLKHVVFIDVLCLGLFFSLRLLAGSCAANIFLSPWILSIVVIQVFFFGFNKRVQELKILDKKAQEHRFVLVKYDGYFIDQLMMVITAATLILYYFYAIDADTIKKVGSSHMLFTVPFFYIGIFRYLYLLKKSKKDEEAACVLFSDLLLWVDIILWILTAIGVVYFAI